MLNTLAGLYVEGAMDLGGSTTEGDQQCVS